ncbi:hypothetical protein [Bacillus taeanensis]|nr:hypothetical protein [Bacillus taeanensis]
MVPTVVCPKCQREDSLENVLTAQSNQNVIYKCSSCQYEIRNIETSKG